MRSMEVAAGRSSANPHHEAGVRTIRRGDLVVLDFGGLKDGYGSSFRWLSDHLAGPS